MYAVKFSCEETGEKMAKGPYNSFDDAICHKNFPGYGSETVCKISDSESLDIIVDAITELTWEKLQDENLDPNDKSVFYPVFHDLIWEYHDQMQPGYDLIPAYMKDKPVPQRDASDVLGIGLFDLQKDKTRII